MGIFPTRILLATDGSKEAGRATETALALAQKTGSGLRVVHVLYLASDEQPGIARWMLAEGLDVLEENLLQAQEMLDGRLRKFEEGNIGPMKAHERLGPESGFGFSTYATRWGSRVGTRGRYPAARRAKLIRGMIDLAQDRRLGGGYDEQRLETVMTRRRYGASVVRRVRDRGGSHAGGGEASDGPPPRPAMARGPSLPPAPPAVLRDQGGEIQMSIFPTRILLASDGAEEAQLAATAAVDLAKTTASELHLVSVFPGPEYVRPYYETHFAEAAARLRSEAREERQEVLDERVERIREAGGSVAQTHIREGETAAEIVALAEELGAGLIAVGSRGLGRVSRMLMGNVSDSVVRHAHCPVLVVRGLARGQAFAFPARILLATDASEEARLAATTAADVAQRTGSELHVVHVGEVRPVIHPERHGYHVRYEELREGAQLQLEKQVEEIVSTGGSVARAHLRMGRPDEEIVLLGEETGADLIVMGSRGVGGIRRALMGSVSDSVVRHAHCPVLVVRHEEEQAA
jgi:nucleotide-binding universal stress UspA family protein